MNKWLASTQMMQNISKSLLQSKQQPYSEEAITYKIMEDRHRTIKHITTHNQHQESLYAILIKSKPRPSPYCILFMHGLASNILEASNIIDLLPHNIDLCCFDFSGSGKSGGKYNTYGYKEQEDIEPIMKALQKQGYYKLILWGRSMGAVACLLHSAATKHQEKIIMQILDSPFNNFQSICRHTAINHMGVPSILVPTAINILKEAFGSHPFNPFNINISLTSPQCRITSLFVYSEQDQVVPYENSQQIIRSLNPQCHYQKLIITQSHNQARSQTTINAIFQKIGKYIKYSSMGWNKYKKKKALGVYSSQMKKGMIRGEEKIDQREKSKKMMINAIRLTPYFSLPKNVGVMGNRQSIKRQQEGQRQMQIRKCRLNKH